MLTVKWKKLNNNTILPKYAHVDDSGFDLCSIEDIVLASGCKEIIKTGLSVEIPKGFEMQIRPRSGLAAKEGITIINSPGTIDSGYRGEIKIILYKHNIETLPKIFVIKKGDRIAQGIITKVYYPKFVEVQELSNSKRGINGFGSTGQN